MRTYSVSIAGCLTLAVAAFAANPALAQGGYIGLSGGYGWSDGEVSTSTVYDPAGYFAQSSVDAINVAGVQEVDPRGFIGGIDIGYDFQSGNLVFGIAADLSTLRDTKSASSTVTYPCCGPTAFTVAQTVSTRWLATVRGRVGVDVGGAVLYATGGYAAMRARYTSQFSDTFASAAQLGTSSKTRSGWVVGAGADIKVAQGWSIQPEFLHADFGTFGSPAGTLTTSGGSFPMNAFTHRAKLKTNIARIGFHFHF
jgi:outer membrane immunogenic protein